MPSLAEARPFYAALLPALGFCRDVSDETWFQFEAENAADIGGFFGITNRRATSPTRRASHSGRRARAKWIGVAEVVRRAGGRKTEGPGYDEGPGYYAVFFEDPCGNRLEICHRVK